MLTFVESERFYQEIRQFFQGEECEEILRVVIQDAICRDPFVGVLVEPELEIFLYRFQDRYSNRYTIFYTIENGDTGNWNDRYINALSVTKSI